MIIFQHLRLVLILLVPTHLLCGLPVTATCFRNGKSYEQCKECLLKAADCHKQNRSYPFQVYMISQSCIVVCVICCCAWGNQSRKGLCSFTCNINPVENENVYFFHFTYLATLGNYQHCRN